MTTRIDRSLDYLGKSDHRFYTMLVGGGFLYISQYVFVWGGQARIREASSQYGVPADVAAHLAVGIGLSALIFDLGYLRLANRSVAAGEETPPRFHPLTVDRWRSLSVQGAVAAAALALTVGVLHLSLTEFVGLVLKVANHFELFFLYDLLGVFVRGFLLVYGPYVLLSVFLVIGRQRPGRKLLSILRFGNRPYLVGWGLIVVLLTFEGSLLQYLSTLIKEAKPIQSQPGADSLLGSFVTFYLLVSIVYLLSDALTDADESSSE